MTAHLKSFKPIYRNLKVFARSGAVSVRGTLDALWKKTEVMNLVAKIPGVTSIDLEELVILIKPISNQKLKAQVQNIIKLQPYLDSNTLTAEVNQGRVVLAGSVGSVGSVGSRETLHKLIDIIEHITGVREVEDLVTVDSTTTLRAGRKAAQLRLQIGVLYPHSQMKPILIGKQLVVEGVCPTLAEKREVLQYLKNIAGLEQIIDKLRV